MFLNLFGIHLLVAVSWAIFLLLFIYTREKFFGYLSLILMIIVLGAGVKLMFLNPSVAKSGGWLHLKLSFDVVLMLENVYLLFKNISERLKVFLFWFSYVAFMIMIALTMFRPF